MDVSRRGILKWIGILPFAPKVGLEVLAKVEPVYTTCTITHIDHISRTVYMSPLKRIYGLKVQEMFGRSLLLSEFGKSREFTAQSGARKVIKFGRNGGK